MIVSTDKIPLAENCQEDYLNYLTIFNKLQEYCDKYNCLGLSAVNIGIPLKINCIYFYNRYRCLLNVEYKNLNIVSQKSIETSPSYFLHGNDNKYQLHRYYNILITGKEILDENNIIDIQEEFVGPVAFIIQQLNQFENKIFLHKVACVRDLVY